MGKPFRVCKDVYMIGGSQISHPYDCAVYMIDASDLVLIDTGAGKSFSILIDNIRRLGFAPERLVAVIATHRHIDHIGSLKQFRDKYGVQIIAHDLDAKAIETGTHTGAEAYGVDYDPCPVDVKLTGEEETLCFNDLRFSITHIPGHTDGSIAIYLDTEEGRILFGQDVHGPYLPEWGGDRKKARLSLQKLIDLRADVLCEGHFGIYQPASSVEKYIRGYLKTL